MGRSGCRQDCPWPCFSLVSKQKRVTLRDANISFFRSIGMRKEKHLVHAYIGECLVPSKSETCLNQSPAVSLIMSLLIWFVPSFIGNAVFATIIGLCLGPIFPIRCDYLPVQSAITDGLRLVCRWQRNFCRKKCISQAWLPLEVWLAPALHSFPSLLEVSNAILLPA